MNDKIHQNFTCSFLLLHKLFPCSVCVCVPDVHTYRMNIAYALARHCSRWLQSSMPSYGFLFKYLCASSYKYIFIYVDPCVECVECVLCVRIFFLFHFVVKIYQTNISWTSFSDSDSLNNNLIINNSVDPDNMQKQMATATNFTILKSLVEKKMPTRSHAIVIISYSYTDFQQHRSLALSSKQNQLEQTFIGALISKHKIHNNNEKNTYSYLQNTTFNRLELFKATLFALIQTTS